MTAFQYGLIAAAISSLIIGTVTWIQIAIEVSR